ncbi:MAG: hypothetical protein WC378_16500 [Opitutaceae bacterium]|jgi:hypothetical protein
MRSFFPPEAPSAERIKRPRFVPRFSDDPDTRSVQIGVGATILVHIFLLMLLPDQLNNELVGSFSPEQRSTAHQPFNIEMAPDEFISLKPLPPTPPPMKFVETNPDVPDNVPDNTNNFGAQNQQAAQLTQATKTGGDRPEMEGRKDINSTQVVSGHLTQTNEIAPPAESQPETPVADKPTPQLRREQNPLPGIERYAGDNLNSYGSNIAKIAPHPDDVQQAVEGSPDSAITQGIPGQQQTVDRSHPRPRPHLDRKARPALFAENKIGTSNIGPMAVDARWSSYGQYLQKMMEAVQAQWEKLLQGRTYPASGSVVTVKFVMDSSGTITNVVSVDGGMAEQQAKGFCVAAIAEPSPYGKWSDDMVAVLGNSQEMTFVFYYQ